MRRRDFCLLQAGHRRVLDVSCERLYMQYVDARLEGRSESFLERVREGLRGAHTVKLHQAFWLEHESLREIVGPVLRELTARGGTVERV